MITKHEARITKELANNKVTVVKEFDTDVENVWEAWTDSTTLDQWWAPKPWRAETKRMDFKEGGHWLYAMVGPDNNRMWARFDYKTIDAPNRLVATDSFADENGNKSLGFPSMKWTVQFTEINNGTRLEVVIEGSKKGDIEKLLEMGFEQGFFMALDNLDELLLTE
jgi:uncharacterized protein YndB with AHSA1/START domain